MAAKIKVKLETFQREGKGWGTRICFLYPDRGPDIFEKDGLPTEQVAMQWGRDMVLDTVKSIPGATAQEDPCQA